MVSAKVQIAYNLILYNCFYLNNYQTNRIELNYKAQPKICFILDFHNHLFNSWLQIENPFEAIVEIINIIIITANLKL